VLIFSDVGDLLMAVNAGDCKYFALHGSSLVAAAYGDDEDSTGGSGEDDASDER
jgi:hypothetical protein